MSPTEANGADHEPSEQHEGLKGKFIDAIDTVKKRIRDYDEGPHDLD